MQDPSWDYALQAAVSYYQTPGGTVGNALEFSFMVLLSLAGIVPKDYKKIPKTTEIPQTLQVLRTQDLLQLHL